MALSNSQLLAKTSMQVRMTSSTKLIRVEQVEARSKLMQIR